MSVIENARNKVLVSGTAEADSITNSGDNATIDALAGDDTIKSSGSNVSINAGIDNNRISITSGAGGGNSILAGDGNDSVQIGDRDEFATEKRYSNWISMTGGNNYVYNSNIERSTIYTGTGNDTIVTGGEGERYGGKTSIIAGAGNNQITVNTAMYYGSIYAGKGKDLVSIVGSGNNNIVSLGGGNDSVFTDGNNLLLDVGEGDNFVTLGSAGLGANTINAGKGNDTVQIADRVEDEFSMNKRFSNVIIATDGNNYIYNSNIERSSIRTGAGNDTIITGGEGEHYGGKASIVAGAGDNLITVNTTMYYGSVYTGKGKDLVSIVGSGNNNIVSLGGGNDSVFTDGNNLLLDVGEGDNFVTLGSAGSGANTINAGKGNDTIQIADRVEDEFSMNKRFSNVIIATDGNNYIYNSNIERSSILTGAGNDTIVTGGEGEHYGGKTSIVAGAGDNLITVNTAMYYGSVYTGAGNDAISVLGGTNNVISTDGGRNTIITSDYYGADFNTNNTVTTGKGSDLIRINGNNSFINAGSGKNSITLAGGKNATIVTGKGDDTITLPETSSGGNVVIFGEGNDLVINFNSGDSVRAVSALTRSTVDSDIVLTDGKSFMTLQGAVGKTVYTSTLGSNDNVYKILAADKTVGDTVAPGEVVDTTPPDTMPAALNVSNSLNNTLITGTPYEDSISNSGSNVTIDGGKGDDYINSNSMNTSINGGKGDDSIFGGGQSVTIDGGNGDDLIFITGSNVSVNAGAGDDSIVNDGNFSVTINGGKGDDSITGGTGTDTLLGGTGDDTLTGNSGNDLFVFSTGSDVITDYDKGDKISLGAAITSATLEGSDAVLTVGKGFLTIQNGKGKQLALIDSAGKEFTTILGGAFYDDSSADKVTVPSGLEIVDASARTKAIKITANKMANSILSGSGNDMISAGNGNDTVYGGAGADSLNGGSGNDYLFGGAGNDTLWGNSGNDVLWGDAGNDLFVLSAGNDVIADYAAGDKISLGAAITSTTLKGSDVVFNFGSYASTVQNGKGQQITLIDSAGKEFTTLLGGAFYDDTSADKVTVPSGVELVDASARTKAIKITANKVANSIVGGSGKDTISAGAGNDTVNGGAGNDSINGGAGNDSLLGGSGNDKILGSTGNDWLNGGASNDTLTGGAGADTFEYSAGRDIITDFADNDLLQITGNFSAVYNEDDNNIAFTVNSRAYAITLQDFTAETFNINGANYVLSGNELVRQQ